MAKSNLIPVPHSWAIEDWPSNVYPGKPSAGRYIVRAHRDALVACGALTRVGRDLVVLGAGYSAWMARQADRVDTYSIAPNSDQRDRRAA